MKRETMTKAPLLILTTLFLLLVLYAAPLHCEALEEQPASTGPCMGEEGFKGAWFDRTHAYLTNILCQPSVWFDNFFGEERSGEEWPGTLLRVGSHYRFDEDREAQGAGSEVSATLRLPKMDRRLRLVVTGDNESEPETPHAGEDPYDQSVDGAGGDQGRSTAGLRFYISDSRRLKAHFGGGVRLKVRLEPYLRFRLRITEPLSSLTLVRLTPAVAWFRDEGINQSLRIDIDRRFGENTLLRATESALLKEEEPGLQWGTALSLFHRLHRTVVAGLEASARGNTFPRNDVHRYRLLGKLRTNFWRPWLFIEIAPELYWPRDELGRFRRYKALTAGVEIQFNS